MKMSKVLTHACLKEEPYWLWSSMCPRCVCVEFGVAVVTGLPALLRMEGRKNKRKEIKMAAVPALQTTHPKHFDFSNMTERVSLLTQPLTVLTSQLNQLLYSPVVLFTNKYMTG